MSLATAAMAALTFIRTGFPSKRYFALGKKRAAPGKLPQTTRTTRPSMRLVMPGTEFCSRIAVGMRPMAARSTIGPEA